MAQKEIWRVSPVYSIIVNPLCCCCCGLLLEALACCSVLCYDVVNAWIVRLSTCGGIIEDECQYQVRTGPPVTLTCMSFDLEGWLGHLRGSQTESGEHGNLK